MLERKLQCKLYLPGRARRRQKSKLARTQHCRVVALLRARLGEEEVCVIGNVEKFGTELQMRSLGDVEHLENREIPDLKSRAKNRVAPGIAK